MTFKCKQCGNCCRQMAICVTYSDIMRWKEQGRIDILREISFTKDAPQGAGFYVAQTILGPKKKPCPFLVNNLCGIHETKPLVCKNAPAGFTKFDECPEWKPKYINRNRLRKTQRRQNKDFTKCVTYFSTLCDILVETRKKWQLRNNT